MQLLAFGSSSSTVVICFRKSDSCIPGCDPRRLNTALGLDKITWRLTANPLWIKKKSNSIKLLNQSFMRNWSLEIILFLQIKPKGLWYHAVVYHLIQFKWLPHIIYHLYAAFSYYFILFRKVMLFLLISV